MLSYNVFILLNSEEVSREYFHTEGRVLSMKNFFLILAAILALLFLLVAFFIKEKPHRGKKKNPKVLHLY